jgi:hypothetical protein
MRIALAALVSLAILAGSAPAATPQALVLRVAVPPITLGVNRVALRVDMTRLRKQVGVAAVSETQSVFLRLAGVEAQTQPGVVWKVSLGGTFVGNLGLYGTGIRDQAAQGFKAASFAYRVDPAIQAWLKTGSNRVALTFTPTGPKAATSVKVAAVTFAILPPTP